MPSILKALASEFHKMGQLLNMLFISRYLLSILFISDVGVGSKKRN